MRVFISQVDSPLGHNLARLLANTRVGSRRANEDAEGEEHAQERDGADAAEEDESAQGDGAAAKPDRAARGHYQVVGTLTDLSACAEDELLAMSKRGQMVETGDKEVDRRRRLALEKFSVCGEAPACVEQVLAPDNLDAIKAAVLASDYIVFNLQTSAVQAQAIAEWLHAQAESFSERPKTLIALSSVMTWARTRTGAPAANEDDGSESTPLLEDDYRRRKPHPNFKAVWNAEKALAKLGKKSSFQTIIVASGFVYHAGDSLFHPLLKAAWNNERELVCYGDGNNVLPMIHLDDLCSIVSDLIENPPANRYVVAVDGSSTTQGDLVAAISDALSTGKVRHLSVNEAYLNPMLNQADIDMLSAHMHIEGGCIKEMSLQWRYETGLLDNLAQFIQEYKDARGLHPLNIVIHGPPAAGKTTLAAKVADHYSLHYIEPELIMKTLVDELAARVAAATAFATAQANGTANAGDAAAMGGAGAADGDAADLPDPSIVDSSTSDGRDVAADRALLDELREYAQKNNGQYPEHHLLATIRKRLLSKPCLNQGYVLDGFPAVKAQALALFSAASADGEDGAGDGDYAAGGESEDAPLHQLLQPGFVFGLEASDDTVKERAMALPEPDCLLYKNSREGFLRRLEQFRADNTDETTVFNFYDEHELFTVSLPADPLATPDQVAQRVISRVGPPRNFGPAVAEVKRRRRVEQEERQRQQEQQEEERQRHANDEEQRQEREYSDWKSRLNEIAAQEREVLDAQSVPLRTFLVKNILPTLTQALVEVCKVRPDDPIDYVAEYLFKHSPDGLPLPQSGSMVASVSGDAAGSFAPASSS